MSTTIEDHGAESQGSSSGSVALIGPNTAHRRIVAQALAGSAAKNVREFVDYPARLSDVPRILEQKFDIVMLDVDSDESYALALIESFSSSGTTVIVYSSRNDAALMSNCMRAGARDFLPLPEDSGEDEEPAVHPVAEEPMAAQPMEIHHVAAAETHEPPAPSTPETWEARAGITPAWQPPVEAHRADPAPQPTEERDRGLFRLVQPVHVEPAEEGIDPDYQPDSKPLANSVDEWDAVHLRLMQEMKTKPGDLAPRTRTGSSSSKTIKDIWAATPLPPTIPETVKPAAEVPQPEVAPDPPKRSKDRWASKAKSPLSIRPQDDSPRSESDPEPPKKAKERFVAAPPVSKRSPLSIRPVEDSPRPEASAELPVKPPAPLTPGKGKWEGASARAMVSATAKPPAPPLQPEATVAPVPLSQSWLDQIADAPQTNTRPRPAVDLSTIGPTFRASEPEVEKKPYPGLGLWMFLAVGFGVLASLLAVFYLHPFRQNPAPIPAPEPAVEAAQAVQPPEQGGKSDHPDWSTIQSQPVGSQTPGQGANAARNSKLVSSDMMDAQLNAPTVIAGDFKKPAAPEEAPPPAINASEMGTGGNVSGAVFNGASQVKVQPAGSAISAGVAEGLLTHRTPVVYPLIAKEAHVSGTVVVGATITKNGTIAGLHVISGPTMLRTAAVDSVKNWRYRPYMLDEKPVDVDTTISVVFSLGTQ